MTSKQTTIVALLLGSLCVNVSGAPARSAGGWKQKVFIITFWCAPPATDEALARTAAEGYNLTWVPADGLDVAARHHLRAMLTSDLLKPEVLDDPVKRALLDALIERVKKHPALEAYFLTDEPGAGAFPGLGNLVAYLRQRDPAHLAYFSYWGIPGGLYVDGKPSPLVKPVAALNAETAKLGPALLELESVAVYHTAPLPDGTEPIPANAPVQVAGPGKFVLGLFGKSGRPSAFMIVNRDYEHRAEAVFRVALPGSQLQELDRTTGKWSKGEALGRKRTVKMKLDPGDGRLFRVTGLPRDEENHRGAYQLMRGVGL